jgi:hypothetical protein
MHRSSLLPRKIALGSAWERPRKNTFERTGGEYAWWKRAMRLSTLSAT